MPVNTVTQMLNVRLDPRLYEWLRARAAAERRTMRATLEMVLEAAIEREGDAA